MTLHGTNVYPLVTISAEKGEQDTIISVHSWVRLKRKKRYYYVRVSDTYIVNNESEGIFMLPTINRLTSRVLSACQEVFYLWRLPKKAVRKRLIDTERTLILCDKDFTDKELFLLQQKSYL